MKKTLLFICLFSAGFQLSAKEIALTTANAAAESHFFEAILSNFTGRVSGRGITLTWSTISETRSFEFVVERRDRSGNYATVGSVSGNGNLATGARYLYTDLTPIQGINIYRLRMVDLNGNYSYSHELQLTYRGLSPGLGRISPNPFLNRIQLTVTMPQQEPVQVRLIDTKGTIVMRQSFTASEGENTLDIESLDRLPSGIYWVLVEASSFKNSQRIFKSL